MKKLRNKVFFTIFTILTISIISFITIFNAQNYIEQKNSVVNSLNIFTDNEGKHRNKMNGLYQFRPIDDNIRFMDSTVYTILMDEDNNIKEIINHSNSEVHFDEIALLASRILNKHNIKNKYIGCLYFSNYSYVYSQGNYLIIFDNSDIKISLLAVLRLSILIFILLEVVVFFISKIITEWIIVPVKESFDKQKQFIADASHELKTPLSVIVASSEALEDNPKEKKWLKNIKSEADRMSLLINDLLKLASSEEKNSLDLKEKDLSKIVELSTLTFEGRAFEKNIKIDYDIDSNIKMKLDENSIKQLVEILLDNATNHSKKGGTINISLKEVNNNIELLVKNMGDEIPRGEESKIFERFYRGDKSRNRDNNRYGLGLAIAKNIVDNHNGEIGASSSDGVTTFKVLFKK